jgi:hypothetical protein
MAANRSSSAIPFHSEFLSPSIEALATAANPDRVHA